MEFIRCAKGAEARNFLELSAALKEARSSGGVKGGEAGGLVEGGEALSLGALKEVKPGALGGPKK